MVALPNGSLESKFTIQGFPPPHRGQGHERCLFHGAGSVFACEHWPAFRFSALMKIEAAGTTESRYWTGQHQIQADRDQGVKTV